MKKIFMKKILFAAAVAALAAQPALAADIARKAPPPAPIAAWNWTGFYAGLNVGGGWANTHWFEDVSGSGGGGPPGFDDGSVNASGVIGGGQIGFDYQTGWAVFGIQADADAAGIRGSGGCFPQVTGTFLGVTLAPQSCSTKIDALGTVTARVGAALDRTLYYVIMCWVDLPGSTSASLISVPIVFC
jgi:outer membrane immunogenic protein